MSLFLVVIGIDFAILILTFGTCSVDLKSETSLHWSDLAFEQLFFCSVEVALRAASALKIATLCIDYISSKSQHQVFNWI